MGESGTSATSDKEKANESFSPNKKENKTLNKRDNVDQEAYGKIL